MQFELPPEVEKIATSAVMNGSFPTIEDFVTAAVLDSPLVADADTSQQPVTASPAQDWQQRFREFLSHQVSTAPYFGDSREDMYPDR